jgi:hypothetical protein
MIVEIIVQPNATSVPVVVEGRAVAIPVNSFAGVPPNGAPGKVLKWRSAAPLDYGWEDEAAVAAVPDVGDVTLIFDNQLI